MSELQLRTLEELKEFYTSTLSTELIPLEKMRIMTVNKSKIWSKIIAIIFILILIVVVQNDIFNIDKTLLICTILFLWPLTWIIGLNLNSRKYRKEFYLKIFAKLIKFVNQESEVTRNGYITWEMLEESKLFHQIDKDFKAKRYELGTINQSSIALARWGENSRKNAEKTSISHLLSKDLFFVIDLNTSFDGFTTLVVGSSKEADTLRYPPFCYKNSFLGTLHDNITRWKYYEANRSVVVFSNNQKESHQIISPSLRRKLSWFYREIRSPIYASFVNSKIYIKTGYSNNIVEQPIVFESILDFSIIHNYFDYFQVPLKNVRAIVKDINKNLIL